MSEFIDNLKNKAGFGIKKRLRFYALIRDFAKDGIPVYDALVKINGSFDDAGLNLFPQGIIQSLMLSMRGGQGSVPATFGEALKPYVEPVEAAMIDAGERSGNLPKGLDEVIRMVETKSRISGVVTGNLAYPVFLLLMLAVLLYMVSSTMLPTLEEIKPRSTWPGVAKSFGWIADNAPYLLGFLFGTILLVAIAFMATASRWTGDVRVFMDKWIAPWSIYRSIQASMILTSLSTFISAGVPVLTSIKQIHQIGTPWQQWHMDMMQSRSRYGTSEAVAIVGDDYVLFDRMTTWEIKLYAERTNFAAILNNIGERSVDRLEASISKVMKIVQIIVLSLVAGMIALVASSFMQVTMSMSGQ